MSDNGGGLSLSSDTASEMSLDKVPGAGELYIGG